MNQKKKSAPSLRENGASPKQEGAMVARPPIRRTH